MMFNFNFQVQSTNGKMLKINPNKYANNYVLLKSNIMFNYIQI